MKKYVTHIMAATLMIAGCSQNDGFISNDLRADIFEQVYLDHRIDMLFVLDNSPTMQPRRDYIRDNFGNFITTINSKKAVDYWFAATTTDHYRDHGQLIQGTGGVEVVKSTVHANATALIASIFNNVTDSLSSFWERGLVSAIDATSLYGFKFMREGVHLFVVFVTDEEDYSPQDFPDEYHTVFGVDYHPDAAFGNEPENNANYRAKKMAAVINYFKKLKASQGAQVHMFPITGLNTTSCPVATVGTRYIELAEAMGGLSVPTSICNQDLAASFNKVANTIANRGVRFPLTKKANETGQGLRVFVNRKLVPAHPDNYIYLSEENAIEFTGFIPGNKDKIEVTYLQNSI